MDTTMNRRLFFLATAFWLFSRSLVGQPSGELIYLDDNGIMKWNKTREEVALFGANYCLPSACDYRAASYFTDDLKTEIERDMTHFVRMGWEGLRVCLWGDSENSDTLGNLINNDHLDLMDYLIFQARERGIYMLFSPIVTYTSQWPDAMDKPVYGFSAYYDKGELGTNPYAIAAQQNYLRQILNHVNPYTGTAIKDEPNILFIEMINEPFHHPEDTTGSIQYINALTSAVRSTGCKKIVFHNVSQDFAIASAVSQSDIQGVTFGWYPSGLVSGHTLKGNFLRRVDHFTPMLDPLLDGMPRIVYEFDQPDLLSPVMYPAMARTFRSVGTQFAAMFSYDMLVSAKANMGWQTHFLNLVYTPQKAASAIIAAEVMRQVPLYQTYGEYPDNNRFDKFRINEHDQVSEYVTEEVMMYAGNTPTPPMDPKKLMKIVGYGNSKVVKYNGTGVYFLDKIKNGVWRLEVYPDVAFVSDPFQKMSPDKIVSRIVYNDRNMELILDDLGTSFSVRPENDGNQYATTAINGTFRIRPGVYTLFEKEPKGNADLPETLNGLAYSTFIAPAAPDLPVQVRHEAPVVVQTGNSLILSAQIVDDTPIDSIRLFLRQAGSWFRKIPMEKTGPFAYTARPGSHLISEGFYDYCLTVYQNGTKTTFPGGLDTDPWDWNFSPDALWPLEIRGTDKPVDLFLPRQDIDMLSFTRIGDGGRTGIFRLVPVPTSGQGALRLSLPTDRDANLTDYTASLYIGDRIRSLNNPNRQATIQVSARGLSDGNELYITLVEADGTSWTKKLSLTTQWQQYDIPVSGFSIGRGVMLPQGFPGGWNYWITPAKGRGGSNDRLGIASAEQLQFSVRPLSATTSDPAIEVSAVRILVQP